MSKIKALYVTRESMDVRSSGDRRNRVDAYFVLYQCPVDKYNNVPHEWVCRFEVPRGNKFVIQDYESKAAASAAKGYTI